MRPARHPGSSRRLNFEELFTRLRLLQEERGTVSGFIIDKMTSLSGEPLAARGVTQPRASGNSASRPRQVLVRLVLRLREGDQHVGPHAEEGMLQNELGGRPPTSFHVQGATLSDVVKLVQERLSGSLLELTRLSKNSGTSRSHGPRSLRKSPDLRPAASFGRPQAIWEISSAANCAVAVANPRPRGVAAE